ncbi:MAG: hypothetical protein II394_07435 [Bacteroidales bacterium]|nr:hypothetical protein [Bacteroidales bacterium]
MINALVDTKERTDDIKKSPSVDEVLARWKARADAYQYNPDKPHNYISLEEFGEKLLTSVSEKL